MADVTQDPEPWARLGAKIRERREEMSMSRRQFAELAGVSEKSIQVAEEGRTPRARWPQSLRHIEHGLGWEPGSMQLILAGGEPSVELDLFAAVEAEEKAARHEQSLLFPAATTEEALPLEGALQPTNHARSKALAALPRSFRAALTEVLPFGIKARNYGADPEVVERYERAVEELLLDLLSRAPISYSGTSGDPGHLALWNTAMRMDPVLRKEREESMRAMERQRRNLTEHTRLQFLSERTPVAGGVSSAEVLREIQKLAEEVARLSAKVDDAQPSAAGGDDRTHPDQS